MTTATNTSTATHTVRLYAPEFRQALTSALLFTARDGSDSLGYICLHIEEDQEHITVNSLDGHGFYRHRLELVRVKDEKGNPEGPEPSLPNGESAWTSRGQLLIPQNAAATILKLIPKKLIKGFVTLEVTPLATRAYGQEVRFTSPVGAQFSFSTTAMTYPDYMGFLARAESNKDKGTTIQGRVFPITEFARIAKALPEKYFTIHWGEGRESPCLIEQGKNIQIVCMPTKWIEDETEEAA